MIGPFPSVNRGLKNIALRPGSLDCARHAHSSHAAKWVAYCALLTLAGCMRGTGQDSWQHYKSGGMFDTGGVSLSPDGQYLAYASACTGNGDIYAIKSGTVSPARLTDSDDFESHPIFTPDGKRIIYVREHDQRSHVWIVGSDGAHATQLTRGDFIDSPIDISRDGRFLLFSRAEPSMGFGLGAQVYLLRLNDPGRAPVGIGDFAVFSGDSRSVICWESEKLWRMDIAGKAGSRSRIQGTGTPLDASFDGKLLLTLRRTPGQEIWVIDTEKNTEKKLAVGYGASFLGQKARKYSFLGGTSRGCTSLPWTARQRCKSHAQREQCPGYGCAWEAAAS